MSREILFKAKRVNWRELTKEEWWVEGNLVWSNDSFEEYRAIIIPKENSDMFTKSENDDLGFEKWYLVDPETVCQYVGLTDEDGKRYEGDIFQADNGECTQIYIIVWDKHCLEWYAECVGDPDGNLPLCEFRVDEIEVIGNVFDNLNLLLKGVQQPESPVTHKEETE